MQRSAHPPLEERDKATDRDGRHRERRCALHDAAGDAAEGEGDGDVEQASLHRAVPTKRRVCAHLPEMREEEQDTSKKGHVDTVALLDCIPFGTPIRAQARCVLTCVCDGA